MIKIKNIINNITKYVFENISRTKECHIFDFDDTIVSTPSLIKVINKQTNKIKEIDPKTYLTYELEPDEYFDLSNFEEVIDPILLPHFDLFKSTYKRLGKDGVVILTARPHAQGVISFLEKQGMGDVTVAAIGVNNPNTDVRLINAYRKKKWIVNLLQKTPIKFLSFYDDNITNIRIAKQLVDDFPFVEFDIKYIENV